MSRQKPALCVHLGMLVIRYCVPVWQYLGQSWWSCPYMVADKSQLLLNSPCCPQRPSVSYFAAAWGRVSWLLLSLYQEAQPLLWESKRQCGTSLQKMIDPFISEISEEDTVVHWACWMLPDKPLGQQRGMAALQSPDPTPATASHHDC